MRNLALVSPLDEISLYFHFPFCKRICPYCHFYVSKAPTDPSQNWQREFLDSLLLDLKLHQKDLEGKKLRSVYFGGGTPSLFEARAFQEILSAIEQTLPLLTNTEVTLEANPETISEASLDSFQKAGINRLSLGVQSLEDYELLRLGRGHASSKALEAIALIQKSGLKNFSLDLMMETPGQTLASWERTLDRICEINPPHLSLYNLVIEPGTVYAKQEKRLRKQMVDNQVATKMLEKACKAFEQVGLCRYEISAFSHKDRESIHNTGYWRGRDFIGFGPSAFSFFEGKRLQKHCDLALWSQDIKKGSLGWGLIDTPTQDVRQAELLAVHLRLTCGVDLESFQTRWGSLPQKLLETLEELCNLGWIEKKNSTIRMSPQGMLFYDRLASELMPV